MKIERKEVTLMVLKRYNKGVVNIFQIYIKVITIDNRIDINMN